MVNKFTVVHSGAYGKPSRLGVKNSGKQRRAVAAACADRARPLKGVTLSVSPWNKQKDNKCR